MTLMYNNYLLNGTPEEVKSFIDLVSNGTHIIPIGTARVPTHWEETQNNAEESLQKRRKEEEEDQPEYTGLEIVAKLPEQVL